jgi:hypothetical protein
MKTNTRKPRPASARAAKPAGPADKLDLAKIHKAEYAAPRKPIMLETTPACYLAVTGEGAPGGEVFEARIGALYAVAFTVKMTRKFAELQDYGVGRLECRYLNLGETPLPVPEKWRWQMLIRTPEFVTQADLDAAVAVLRKRGKEGDTALVRLETIDEGRCVQMLHAGPYDRETETVEAMRAFAATRALRLTGPHHEIYISDPRRIAPEKLKTILRLPAVPA